jgi:MFS family permease
VGQVVAASTADDGRAHGTALAALRNRNFRIIWIGMFLSNIGTWMQTVILPAYIDRRTESGALVGMFMFAQLGPLLLLSIPGGVLADKFPRRAWLITMQVVALVLTLAMALLVSRDAAIAWLLFVQLLIGISNALSAPAMQGTIPALVDNRDLPGAISLNSVMINGSRVIGPVLAALIMSRGLGIPEVLVLNALTYVFVIVALLVIAIPHIGRATDAQGWANLTVGLRIVRQRTVLQRILLGMSIFSFLCLPFVGLFPTIARTNFALDTGGSTYKWLYATWGLGAMLGALAVGSVLATVDKRRLIPPFMLGFAVCLAVFALLRDPGPAFVVGFALGFCYFAMTTSMLTVLQQNLRNSERARVMSLWFMAFGGTVAIGNLVFGPVMDAIGATPVLLLGAVTAVWLAWWCDVARRPVRTLADETESAAQRGGDAVESGSAAGLHQDGIAIGE